MNWIKINNDNLPDKEILVVNNSGDYLVGYLNIEEYDDYPTCESDGILLERCTHYCILEKPE